MKHILCYGDSNTWGHNPTPRGDDFRYHDDERWTGILADMLAGKAKVIEEGLCGRTIMHEDPLGPYRNGQAFLGCCLQSHMPLDLVIFMLGTNDIRHIFTPSVVEIAIGMDNLVRMTQNPMECGPFHVPKVLVIAPPPVRDEIAQSDFYGQYDEESVRKSKLLAEAYKKTFDGRPNVTVLDAGQIAEVSINDCIHMTADGHRALAQAVYEQIEKMIF